MEFIQNLVIFYSFSIILSSMEQWIKNQHLFSPLCFLAFKMTHELQCHFQVVNTYGFFFLYWYNPVKMHLWRFALETIQAQQFSNMMSTDLLILLQFFSKVYFQGLMKLISMKFIFFGPPTNVRCYFLKMQFSHKSWMQHSDDNYFKTHFQHLPAATTECDISNWWKVKGKYLQIWVEQFRHLCK